MSPASNPPSTRSASGFMCTNHWVLTMGSTTEPVRLETPSDTLYSRVSVKSPDSSSALTTALRPTNRSRPRNCAGVRSGLHRFPFRSITLGCSSACRAPISQSVGSWAGVIFSAPTPKSISTASSSIIGIKRSVSGILAFKPTRCLNLESWGCTAIATSAKMVSGRWVAIRISPASPLLASIEASSSL